MTRKKIISQTLGLIHTPLPTPWAPVFNVAKAIAGFSVYDQIKILCQIMRTSKDIPTFNVALERLEKISETLGKTSNLKLELCSMLIGCNFNKTRTDKDRALVLHKLIGIGQSFVGHRIYIREKRGVFEALTKILEQEQFIRMSDRGGNDQAKHGQLNTSKQKPSPTSARKANNSTAEATKTTNELSMSKTPLHTSKQSPSPSDFASIVCQVNRKHKLSAVWINSAIKLAGVVANRGFSEQFYDLFLENWKHWPKPCDRSLAYMYFFYRLDQRRMDVPKHVSVAAAIRMSQYIVEPANGGGLSPEEHEFSEHMCVAYLYRFLNNKPVVRYAAANKGRDVRLPNIYTPSLVNVLVQIAKKYHAKTLDLMREKIAHQGKKKTQAFLNLESELTDAHNMVKGAARLVIQGLRANGALIQKQSRFHIEFANICQDEAFLAIMNHYEKKDFARHFFCIRRMFCQWFLNKNSRTNGSIHPSKHF